VGVRGVDLVRLMLQGEKLQSLDRAALRVQDRRIPQDHNDHGLGPGHLFVVAR
jgi:hypothetical protein